jgi:serine/threonine protein kinase/WD40 repeat protein
VSCEPYEALIARGADGLAPDQLRELAQHLEGCRACQETAALYGVEVRAQPARELPRVLAQTYLRDRVLGVGGMGITYAGWDVRLERPVAIKQPHDREGDAQQQELVRRFAREARLTARLQHPAIVTVYEAGYLVTEDGDRPFYAMEPIDGHPLDIEIATRRTLEERLKLLPQLTTIANAAAYAHEHGVIHRDIKPANILVGRFGEAVLIDWGLAKEQQEADLALTDDAAGALTRAGAGTPSYMPPEQAAGAPADPRVDVYALGATLYHLLAGVEPYHGSESGELRKRLFAGPPQSCNEIEPRIPRELVAIVERAMDRDPEARFANAGALARELGRFQAGQLVESYRHSSLELIVRWIKRHRAVVSVMSAALLLIAIVSVISVRRVLEARGTALAAEQRTRASEGRAIQIMAHSVEARARIDLGAGRALPAAEAFVRARALGDRRAAPRIGLARALELAREAPRYVEVAKGRALTQIAALRDDEVAVNVAGVELVMLDTHGGHKRSVPYPDGKIVIAAAPAGDRIAVAGTGGLAELVGTETAPRVTKLAQIAPAASYTTIAYSADGRRVAAGDPSHRIVVWSVASAAVERVLHVPAEPTSIAFGADGTIAFTEADFRSIFVWSVERDRLVRELPAGHSLPYAVKSNPAGDRWVVPYPDGTRTWAPGATEPTVLATYQGVASEGASDAAFSRDGHIVADLHSSGVELWDVERGELVNVIPGANDDANAIAITSGGDVVLADGKGRLRVMTSAPGRVVARFEPRITANSLSAIMASAGVVAVANTKAAQVSVLHIDRAGPAVTFRHDGITRVNLSEDGCTLGVLTNHEKQFEAITHDLCGARPATSCVVPAALANPVSVEMREPGRVAVYGLEGWTPDCAGEPVRVWCPGCKALVAPSASTRHVGVVSDPAHQGVYDESGARIASCDAGCGEADWFVGLPELRGLALIGARRFDRLDFATDTRSQVAIVPDDEVRTAFAISHDASVMAIGDEDGLITFIDVDDGDKVFELVASAHYIDKIQFAPSDDALLVVSDDGALRRIDFTLPADPAHVIDSLAGRLSGAGVDGKLPPESR